MGIFNPKENFKTLLGTFKLNDEEKSSKQPPSDLIGLDGSSEGGQQFLDEVGLDISRRVAPSSITFKDDYMTAGNVFMRTLYISEYPSRVPIGWLQSIYQYQEAMDISFFIQPLEKENLLKVLRRKIAHETAQINQQAEAGDARDFEREKRLEDSLSLQEALEREETKPFQVSFIITIKAKTKEQLDIITDAIERKMSGIQAHVRRASRRQKDGLLSVLPAGKNYLQDAYSTRNMQTHAVQTMFPLTSSDISHDSGVLYGVNMTTHSNVILDRFKLDNPNMIVLGKSGSGKSFTAKMEMLRWLMHGVPVVVIDPQNEYQRLCEALGGQFISISVNSHFKINPLDFSFATYPGKDVLTEKVLNVVKLLGSMLSEGSGSEEGRGLDAEQRAIIDEALLELYRNYGYANDPATQEHATAENMPLLSDLYDLLLSKVEARENDPNFRAKIGPLVAVLKRYIRDGSLAGLFDKHTNVDLRSNLIVFNVQGLDKDLVGVGMHGILEFVRTTMLTVEQLSSGQKKLIYIDEAHRLMKFRESAAFIEDLAKTVRKFNIGLTVLTQDPEDFLKNRDGSIRPEGVTIVRNCAMQILLNQHKNGIPVIAEIFGLTEAEADYLMRTERGEGLLFAQEEHAWLSMRNMASPMEYELITTNPEEVALITARQRAIKEQQNRELLEDYDSPQTQQPSSEPIRPAPRIMPSQTHVEEPGNNTDSGSFDPVADRVDTHKVLPTMGVTVERQRRAAQEQKPKQTMPAFEINNEKEIKKPTEKNYEDPENFELPEDLF